MGYILVTLNAALYILALCVFWKKNKEFDAGVCLLFIYAISSFMCAFHYYSFGTLYEITLIPFIYLFVSLMISFRPFMINSRKLTANINLNTLKFLKPFTYFYIVCGIIALYYSFNDIYNALFVADVTDLLKDAYGGDVAALYHNQLERICKNICGYTGVLALILGFYYMTERQKHYKIALLIIFINVMLTASTNVVNASRGFVAQVAFHLVLCFLLFKPYMSEQIRKKMLLFGCLLVGVILFYAISVTLVRFDKATTDHYEGPLESFFYYFGHSMLVFNNGLVDKIQSYMWGGYIFGKPMMNVDVATGTTASGSYYTFIGALYYDFGPIGTLFVVTIISSYLYHIIRNKHFGIPELVIYVYFLFFVADGMLVIGPGYWPGFLMLAVLYSFLKILQNKKTTQIVEKND